MLRSISLILFFLMIFSMAGCKTFSEFLESDSDDSSVMVEELNLDKDQAYLLRSWYHNAVVADDVQDYSTAIMYYSKIVEYFPETKKAALAGKRLDLLKKAR